MGLSSFLRRCRTRLTGKSAAYEARMRQEIERYRAVENVHDLPEIFHLWSHGYVRTKMERVLGVSGFDDFYIKYILRFAHENPGGPVEIVSLGAGNSDMEVGLGKLLRKSGFVDFRFRCFDVNPDMLARGFQLASQAGLEELYSFEQIDAAKWRAVSPVGVVIVHQSLHHFLDLESIFANIKIAIGDRGYFLTNDMIGRNGHQRWPEALIEVRKIWRTMPDRYKYNRQLGCFEKRFKNRDYSIDGFEGIRAQDILPLLIKTFHFEAFVAYGNVVDVFIDRGFGHNFDPGNTEDVAFIEHLGALDEKMVDEGAVKPCQMIAVMRGRPVASPQYYRHWSPEFCVRDPRARTFWKNFMNSSRRLGPYLQHKA